MGWMATAAQADALPVTPWVALQVRECRDVSFQAPDHSMAYVRGDSHRTTQISGRVVEAGIDGVDPHKAWQVQFAQNHQALLPPKGQAMTVVLPQSDTVFCQTALGQVRRLVYDQRCDTFPRRGECLPPHQLVQPRNVP